MLVFKAQQMLVIMYNLLTKMESHSFFKDFMYLFLERGEGREKERKKNIHVWLPFTRPPLGTWLTTQACVLTGNWTSEPLVHRPALYPLSHTSQGWNLILYTALWPAFSPNNILWILFMSIFFYKIIQSISLYGYGMIHLTNLLLWRKH